MTHRPVNTGAGWYCSRCNVAWDQGEPEPPDCLPTTTDRGVQPLGPPRSIEEEINHLYPHTMRTLRQMSTPDPMAVQVGGAHYKKLAIQPTEFCLRNNLDPAVHAILKYVVRWRDKGGLEDLEKSIHYVEIREKFADDLIPLGRIDPVRITMLEFVTRNNIPNDEADVLYRLEAYYLAYAGGASSHCARRLIEQLRRLIEINKDFVKAS